MASVEVLREVRLGRTPAPVARRERLVTLREEALALAQDLDLVRACAAWEVVALDVAPDGEGCFRLAGRQLRAPWLVPEAGELRGLVFIVATIGAALEEHAAVLFRQGRRSLGLALDGVGNELLSALTRKVQDRVLLETRKQGLSVAGELRPGDPGLPLQDQALVLDLAGAQRIGVRLAGSLMMHPAKSASLVQAVGLGLPRAAWSRCDSCRSRPRCRIAAEAA